MYDEGSRPLLMCRLAFLTGDVSIPLKVLNMLNANSGLITVGLSTNTMSVDTDSQYMATAEYRDISTTNIAAHVQIVVDSESASATNGTPEVASPKNDSSSNKDISTNQGSIQAYCREGQFV